MTAPSTYSLEQAAEILCGNADPDTLQWLVKRLRHASQPHLNGFKAARRWRMTDSDIEDAIERLRPKRVDVPQVPEFGGMTRTSRRRIAS